MPFKCVNICVIETVGTHDNLIRLVNVCSTSVSDYIYKNIM